jgi:outer membrane biogenesis lipoprotein LolB
MKNSRTLRVAGFLVLAVYLFAGCTTTEQQRKTSEKSAVRKQATEEIERICQLEGAERAAALERLRKESGFVLYCAEK